MRPLILLLLVILALFLVSAGSTFAQAKLQIVGGDFEFGTSPQGATVVNYFWFKSVGKDTVHIQQLKTGCDCATMPLTQPYLAPGDSELVGFFWDTQNKIGQTGRYPYIYVDGAAEPYRMALKMQVSERPDSTRPISLKPFKVELARMPSASVDSVAIVFTNHMNDPLALKVVSNVPAEFAYKIPDTLPGNGTAKGFVRVAPSMIDKEFKSSLTIEWTGPGNQTGRFTVPIRRKLFG